MFASLFAKLRWRHRTAALLFAIFLDLVGFGIMFPDVQLRAQAYGAPGWLIGGILASYYVVQMLVSPWWGRLSDRVGRKPVLVACGLLSAFSMVLYALGDSVLWMLLSRLAAGFGAANVVAAQAYIADTTAPAERGRMLGRVGAAVSAGLVAGPVLGGVLAGLGGNLLLGLVAAAMSGIGALWIAIAVPHRPPIAIAAPAAERVAAASRQGVLAVLRGNPPLARLFVVAAIGWFALACLEGTFGRLIGRTLGYGQFEFGLLLGLEAGVALVQGTVFAWLATRLSARTLLQTAYALQAVGLAGMPFAPNGLALGALSLLFGLGVGIASPTINGAASALTPNDRQGEVFGLLQSSRALGFLIGPILGGALFDRSYAALYVGAGLLMALAIIAVAPALPRRSLTT